MRSLGTMLSTSVQADRHGPSITTRSPDSRTFSNRSRNGPTSPPGLSRMRTSARAIMLAITHSTTASRRTKMMRVLLKLSPVSQMPAQGRQTNAGGIETAIDRKNLPGNVARSLRTEEEDGFRQFLFETIAVERDRVVIVGADGGSVNGFCHCGVDRSG